MYLPYVHLRSLSPAVPAPKGRRKGGDERKAGARHSRVPFVPRVRSLLSGPCLATVSHSHSPLHSVSDHVGSLTRGLRPLARRDERRDGGAPSFAPRRNRTGEATMMRGAVPAAGPFARHFAHCISAPSLRWPRSTTHPVTHSTGSSLLTVPSASPHSVRHHPRHFATL